jgi:hypothetical protein
LKSIAQDWADNLLKQMMGVDFDPNWREKLPPQPPPPPPLTLAEKLERERAARQSITPFLATGYRIQKSTKPTRHRMGGRLRSEKPCCTVCGKPCVLFANLDATDRRLRGDYPFQRLPLYCCCACPASLHYRMEQSGRVQVLPSKAEEYEECPFSDWPAEMPRGFLSLVEISPETDQALTKALLQEGFETLTTTERKAISRILGRKPSHSVDVYLSQIGGYLNSFQGGEEGKPDRCPNRSCTVRRRKRLEFQYRPLAVLDLWNDRFWGDPQDALQIVYHICPGCFSISAKYTCT